MAKKFIPAGKKKCIDISDAYNANSYVFMQVFSSLLSFDI